MTMENDKDILGKADALLRRHAIAPPASGSDTGGVPILTELVDAPDSMDSDDALAREVCARVIAEVEGRLAEDLEKRLVQHLVPQVHAAVASALGDLRQELANAIGDAVAQALSERKAP
jgi:hypothetical protein